MSLIESLDWASPSDFPSLDRARKTGAFLWQPWLMFSRCRFVSRRRLVIQRSGITPAKLSSIHVV